MRGQNAIGKAIIKEKRNDKRERRKGKVIIKEKRNDKRERRKGKVIIKDKNLCSSTKKLKKT